MRLACLLLLVIVAAVAAKKPTPPPPPPPQPTQAPPAPPGSKFPPYICFQLPENWCNTFNLTLDKFDSVGNAYYYGACAVHLDQLLIPPTAGVDTDCFDDQPEDVLYGMYYQATNTFTVKCASHLSHR